MKICITGPVYGLLMMGATAVSASTQDHLLRVSTSTATTTDKVDLSTILAKIEALEASNEELKAKVEEIDELKAKVERLEKSQDSHRRRLEEVEFASDDCTPALRTEFLKNETTGAFILDFNGDKIVERRACVFPPVGRYEFIDNFVKFDGRVDFNNDVTFDDNVTFSDFVHFDDTDGIYFKGHNPISGDIELKDDLSVKGDVYTYGNVEFHTGDHDEINFKGSGEIYFNDDLHVVSQDSVEWSFDGDGDVEFVNNKVIVDTHERLEVKVNTNFRKSVYVSNDFHVDGHTYLDGDVTIEGLLTANGRAVIQGTVRRRELESDGQDADGEEGDRELIAVGCALQVNGDSCVAGDLDVAGDITGITSGTFPPFTAPPTSYPLPAPVTSDLILNLLRDQPLEVLSITCGSPSRRDLGERKLMAPPGTILADKIEATTVDVTETIMAAGQAMSPGNSGNTPAAGSSTTCECDTTSLESDITTLQGGLSDLKDTVNNLSPANNQGTSATCGCGTEISELKAELTSGMSDIDTDVGELKLEVGWNWGNITEIKSNLPSSGNTDNNGLPGRVSALEDLNLGSRVTTLEGTVATAVQDIGSLSGTTSSTCDCTSEISAVEGSVTALETTVNTLATDAVALEGRVESLETAMAPP